MSGGFGSTAVHKLTSAGGARPFTFQVPTNILKKIEEKSLIKVVVSIKPIRKQMLPPN